MENWCITILFGLCFVALTRGLFSHFARRIICRILRVNFERESFNYLKLVFKLTTNRGLSGPITSICLVVRVTSLRRVGLPIRFDLSVLIASFFRWSKARRQAIGASCRVRISVNNVFQVRDRERSRVGTVARNSSFRVARPTSEIIRGHAFSSAICSARSICVQTWVPNGIFPTPWTLCLGTLSVFDLLFRKLCFLAHRAGVRGSQRWVGTQPTLFSGASWLYEGLGEQGRREFYGDSCFVIVNYGRIKVSITNERNDRKDKCCQARANRCTCSEDNHIFLSCLFLHGTKRNRSTQFTSTILYFFIESYLRSKVFCFQLIASLSNQYICRSCCRTSYGRSFDNSFPREAHCSRGNS